MPLGVLFSSRTLIKEIVRNKGAKMKQVIYATVALLLISGCTPGHDAGRQTPEIQETPAEFLARSEKEMLELGKEVGLAQWLRATYITPDTGELAARASERALAFDSALIAQAKKLQGVPADPETARAIELILRGSSMPVPNDPKLRAELAKLATDLEGLYGAGKACDENGENCKTLPELENILAASRDYDEQLQAWLDWREVSPPMRPMYQRFVELMNQGALCWWRLRIMMRYVIPALGIWTMATTLASSNVLRPVKSS